MRLYETGFLISPNVTEEEADILIQQMADIVTQKNGKMAKLEKWGKRRMAYQIGKFGEAYYVFFHYDGGPDIPLELGRRFRQMDTILRYLTLVKETQQNVRKKKKAVDRRRAKETAAGEPTEPAAEGGTPEPRKREEA
ncbi:MAG: 30S ribosomal protein S6 [Candidatus Aminicenantes bacterium]|nr:30S ribosomal protein S6 [Candidatus Aminicenantes bacterium]